MSDRNSPPRSNASANRKTAAICAAVVFGMVGVAYAAVPLYDLFCRVTGFGGTPMVGTSAPGTVVDRAMTVRFDSNVAPGLNWRFSPEVREVDVKLGETRTVLYKVQNTGPSATTGVATFNVQPALAGAYFVKLQCFCFTEQTLQPGETMESAVMFYVDPALADDPNLKDVGSITLSYTYFPAKTPAPAVAAAKSGS